jgi:hypothetical protein
MFHRIVNLEDWSARAFGDVRHRRLAYPLAKARRQDRARESSLHRERLKGPCLPRFVMAAARAAAIGGSRSACHQAAGVSRPFKSKRMT